MANSWFRFKQFTIHQDRCAMKVGTDGVLLGALAPVPQQGNVLDIGTGTGLVALMLAQRSQARVDAVESDPAAAGQAAANIQHAPWPERMQVMAQRFEDYYPACGTKYDLIVSNPPYFRHSLKPRQAEKKMARHGSDAFYRELLQGSAQLLRSGGKACFILPPGLAEDIEAQALAQGFALLDSVAVYSKAGRPVIRKLLTLGQRKEKGEAPPKQLIIYEPDGSYTLEFQELLRPFYLTI